MIAEYHIAAQKAAIARLEVDARGAARVGALRAEERMNMYTRALRENLEVLQWARRAQQRAAAGIIDVDGVTLDTRSRTVQYGDTAVVLGELEYVILAALMSSPERVWSHAELYQQAHGAAPEGGEWVRSITAAAARLRAKLAAAGCEHMVGNLYGRGYRLHATPTTRVDADIDAEEMVA